MEKKKIRNDIILISSLLLVLTISLLIVLFTRQKDNLIAQVYVQNDIVETIDLSKKEDKDYIIQGKHTSLTIRTHDGAICVFKGNCPHKDCEHMGYVKETNRPIVCAYNAVYIIINGASDNDIEV